MNTKNTIEVSQNFIDLTSEINDIEEYIKEDKINVIPIPKNQKEPKLRKWNTTKHSLSKIKTWNGNYGMLIGYHHSSNGKSIACIDIDGYTMNGVDDDKKYEVKKATQQYIYGCLKDLPNTMQVRTQSGGYHIYSWNETLNKEIHETSKNLLFPKDFPIQELANKSLQESIEIFTYENSRQMVLPSSTYNGNEYKVIGNIHKLSDIGTAKDINKLVIDTLVNKGFTYTANVTNQSNLEDIPKVIGYYESDRQTDLISLSEDDIKRVVSLTSPIFLMLDGVKNKAALYLGGYFSYHIDKVSANAICNGIIKEVGNVFEDSEKFKKILLENYNRSTAKGGLPKLCELITARDNSFNIDYFSKSLAAICEDKSNALSYTGVYHFYTAKEHYVQRNKGIYQIITNKKENTQRTVPKAIFSIDKLIRFTDVLDLSEPLYTLTYYNGYDGELKTIEKQTKESILKKLMKEDLFNTTVEEATNIFRSIRHELHNKGMMDKQKTILHKGFFMDDDGKLISNTNIDDLNTSPSDLKEAMQLLIEMLMSNVHSQYENATVLRKLLAMPFNYCIKQLGYAEDNTNGLILYGKAKTGKTAICKIGLWFYLEEPYNYNASTDTLSSLVRRLGSTTFYTIFDDSYGLLKNESVQNTIKKGMYEKYSRTVSDRDSTDVLEYLALSTPVFTYNEHIPIIDDGLERRLDKIQYDKNNVISREDSISFKMKYNPLTKNSVLEKLHHIGIAFKDWIRPYLESESIELNDMDSLTLKFFRETLSDLGLEYDPLTTKYNYETNIEDYGGIIRSHFNKELLRSKIISRNGVSIGDLMNIADSGYFNWLGYQPKNHQFIIIVDSFITECNKITNHSFSFEDLMSELEITDYEVKKQIKVKGKTPKATFINEDDLIHNILNINALLYEREAETVSPPSESIESMLEIPKKYLEDT